MIVYKSPEIMCCVHGCDSKLSLKTFERIKFHAFPARKSKLDGKDLLLTWIESVKLPRKFSKRMRVCSLHFVDEDFVEKDGKRELKKDAIPSKNLPKVWRNKFLPRDFGKMIKLLEYRGIGRLRLCLEAKLVKRLRFNQLRLERKRTKIKVTKVKEKDEENQDDNSMCIPKVSTTFSLSTNTNEQKIQESPFTSEIVIKDEPLSENEDMEGDYTMNDDLFAGENLPIKGKEEKGEDTVEEMLAKMNAEDDMMEDSKEATKKILKKLSIDFDDPVDSPSSQDKYFKECEDEYMDSDRYPEFECVPCGKVFHTNRQLNAHNLSHFEYRTKKLSPEEQKAKDQMARETTCKVCHKVLSTKMTLSEHMLIHSGEKPHICMLCDKAFRHKANLVQHVNTHTLARNYKCKMCRQYFYTLEDLDKHVRKHRVVKKEYSCRECGQSFRSKASCWAHLNSHARGRAKAGLACHVCGRILSTKATLKEHMFIHSGEKPFECLLCGKKIRHRANFIIHVQGHSLGQPHICGTCGVSFAKKGELNSHIANDHPDDRPFSCIICGMRFRTETRFHKHAVTHDASLEEEV